MTTLSQAVQDAIQQELPGLVSGELKTFIANAEANALALTKAKEQLAVANDTAASLNAKLSHHRELDIRERELGTVADKLREQELALLKREAVLEAKIATAELGGVKDTMAQFLRNVTIRQHVIEDVSKAVEGSPGGPHHQGTPGFLTRSPDGRLDTITKTETKE